MNQNKIFFSLPNVLLHFFLSCLFLTFFSTQRVDAQYQKTQKAVYEKMGSYINAYYESLPVDYAANPSKKYPLLIFIHGKGELGNGSSAQLPLVLRNGPPKLLNEGKFPSSFTVGGQSHSFIVISPQINTYDYALSTAFVNQMLTYCLSKYRVDQSRIYITGLSMGGMIGWRFAGDSKDNADKIAASVLVCSGASSTASRIKNIATSKLPVWLTNNSNDPVISAASATAAVAALNAFVPPPPKALLSIFSASGHDAWTKTYDPNFKQDGLNVYEWMLSYSRGTATPSPDPLPPTANAGTNQSITLPTNSVTLDGSKSTTASGSIVSYTWTKVSGPAATITSSSSAKTTVTGLVAGTYQFSLMVKDSNGKSASGTVSVIVNAEVVPLNANAGSNQTITLPVNSVTVDGSIKSTYPAGSTFLWVKRDGPGGGIITSPTSLKTTITGLNTAGDYRFQLQITDKNGNLSASSVHVIVNPAPANPAPVEELKTNAGSNQTITLPVNSVTVDGSIKSTYPAGSTFLWVKRDGPGGGIITSPTSLKTTITGLNTAGDYRFQLQITDKNGNLSASSMHVIVNPAPANPAPVEELKTNAGSNQTITLPVNSVTVDGSIKSTYPAGSTFLWVKRDGPGGGIITSPTSLKTTITGLNTAGDYRFQLQITDKNGNLSASSMHVIVNPAPASVNMPPLYADAGGNQTITLPVTQVKLDGSAKSTAPEGSVHIWKQTAGPVTANILYPYSMGTNVTGLAVAGIYKFQLVITDPKGNVSTSTVTITVNSQAGVVPLYADAGGNQTITLPVTQVKLDGSTKSTAPEGSTHIWKQTGGPVTVNILYPYSIGTNVTGLTVVGTYKFQLVLTDPKGNVSTSTTTITVKSAVSARIAGDQEVSAAVDQPLLSGNSDMISTSEGLDVKIYPNPIQSDMNVWIETKETGRVNVVVYNYQGVSLFQRNFVKYTSGRQLQSFNISKLPAGVYLLKVSVEDKYQQTVRIVKQ